MNRRNFLARSLAATAAGAILRRSSFAAAAKSARPPRILLRSSWQSVNIGDIGHTPGALSLLEKHFPEAEITLWPGELGHGSRDLLMKGFPRLKIVEGSVIVDKPSTAALTKAWSDADIYLSGSGSGFPASAHAVTFHKVTGKPVGVFGVSTDPISGIGKGREAEGGTLNELWAKAAQLPPTHLSADLRYIIDRSAFFFCRDTISRDYLKAQGVKTPVLEFGPDAQLGMHLRDDAKGLTWLRAHGLEEGKFICVIPRLRYTPYYRIRANAKRTPDDDIKDAINDRTTEKDHAKLRDMIVAYVKATGNKVMVCAEMTYQVEMGRDVLVNPLPAEIKKNVVWRDTYWLPDEAASIYSKAQCVISVECHSPLIALHNGTPTFYVRQPTDTCKGQMYRDIGANDWFFEVDETNGPQLWSRLETIHKNPAAARAKVKSIMATVEARQKRMVEAVREACHA
jgi:hypothetical protein